MSQYPSRDKGLLPSDASESARRLLLADYAILDTSPEQLYNDLAALAALICEAPVAAVTFFDGERQWFKATEGSDIRTAPMEHSFCTYIAIEPTLTLAVSDASKDVRFANAPHVLGDPKLRAYAGAGLLDPSEVLLGTICVFDVAPRDFSESQISALSALSRQVMSLLQLRRRLLELERRSAELSAVNKELDQFGYIVSHDLKAPIRQQSAFAEMIREDYVGQLPAEVDELLAHISTLGKRADRMLDDINAYLHTSSLKGEAIGMVPLQQVFESACQLVERPIGAQIILESTEAHKIQVPSAPVRHILANLIGNAVKYCDKPAARVQVTATQYANRLELLVADNGPGVTEAERSRIFQMFGRGVQADRAPGRGLGLAICQRLVRSLHGEIDVQNQPNAGACFRVSIPLQRFNALTEVS